MKLIKQYLVVLAIIVISFSFTKIVYAVPECNCVDLSECSVGKICDTSPGACRNGFGTGWCRDPVQQYGSCTCQQGYDTEGSPVCLNSWGGLIECGPGGQFQPNTQNNCVANAHPECGIPNMQCGEMCSCTCVPDSGFVCGNAICDVAAGEDCRSCPQDCGDVCRWLPRDSQVWLDGKVTGTEDGIVQSDELISSQNVKVDKVGHTLEAKDPLNRITKFFFGSNANKCINNPSPNPFNSALVTCIRNNNNKDSQVEYNNDGTVFKVIDENNQITEFGYDNLNRLIGVKKPGESSFSQEYQYNIVGDQISPTNLNTVTITQHPNSDTNIISISYSDGLGRGTESKLENNNDDIKSKTTFNEVSLPRFNYKPYLESQGPGDKVETIYKNDPLARIDKVIPLGASPSTYIQYTYGSTLDALKYKSIITDEAGKTTEAHADKFGNQVYLKDPMNYEYISTYDILGNLETITNPKGQIITNDYDSLGRKKSVSQIDMGTIQYKYNDDGSIWKKIVNGQEIIFTYDNLGRVTLIDYPNALDKSLTYDNCLNGIGKLCSDSYNGIINSYEYDEKGRLTRKVVNIAGVLYTIENSFDNSNIVKIINPDGSINTFDYNHLNQLVEVNVNNLFVNPNFEIDNNNDNKPDSWPYLNPSSLTTKELVTSPVKYGKKSLHLVAVAADAGVGQNVDVIQSQQYTLSADIYVVSGSVKIGIQLGSSTAYTQDTPEGFRRIKHTFTASTSLITLFVESNQGAAEFYVDGIKLEKGSIDTGFTFSENYYNTDNTLQQVESGNNVKTNYYYNPRNMIVASSTKKGSSPLYERTYVYDSLNGPVRVGNLYSIFAGINPENPGSWNSPTVLNDIHTFTYDNLYRLTQDIIDPAISPNGITKVEYTYDQIGNREDYKVTQNSQLTTYDYTYLATNTNKLYTDGIWNYNYDTEGNVISKVKVGTPTENFQFVYNKDNLLIQATVNPGGQNIQYVYDANNNKVQKTDLVKGTTHHYIYGSSGLLMEKVYCNNPTYKFYPALGVCQP